MRLVSRKADFCWLLKSGTLPLLSVGVGGKKRGGGKMERGGYKVATGRGARGRREAGKGVFFYEC